MSATSVAASIFRQNDIRGVVGRDLTEAAARAVGVGYAALARERGVQGAIAVGRDNRPSGDGLRDALIGGLNSMGFDVVDLGVVPTPVTYWALHHENVVGGIQITGSHNPPEYNGFKLSLGTDSIHGSASSPPRLRRRDRADRFASAPCSTHTSPTSRRAPADSRARCEPCGTAATARPPSWRHSSSPRSAWRAAA